MSKIQGRSGPLIFLFLLPILIIAVGCSTSDDNSTSTRMNFDIVDSLLGGRHEITEAGIAVNIPAGFESVSDSVMEMMRSQLTGALGQESGVSLSQCFIDESGQAGVIVSVIDDMNLSADTGSFALSYRQSLHDTYGVENVREGDYYVDRVFVKNFLVTDQATVRFNLLCMSEQGNAAELIYYATVEQYQFFIKHFESSIGTLTLINQGGEE